MLNKFENYGNPEVNMLLLISRSYILRMAGLYVIVVKTFRANSNEATNVSFGPLCSQHYYSFQRKKRKLIRVRWIRDYFIFYLFLYFFFFFKKKISKHIVLGDTSWPRNLQADYFNIGSGLPVYNFVSRRTFPC